MDVSKIRKLGTLPVQLEGEICTAPFSQQACLWYDWIHSVKGLPLNRGFTTGHGRTRNSCLTVKSTAGDLTIYPEKIMLYIAPSFDGKAVIDGKEEYVREYCLKPEQTYYAFAEKFTYRLPPFRFFPFITRRKKTWILALSDGPLEKGRPLHPLIPTRQGMTG